MLPFTLLFPAYYILRILIFTPTSHPVPSKRKLASDLSLISTYLPLDTFNRPCPSFPCFNHDGLVGQISRQSKYVLLNTYVAFPIGRLSDERSALPRRA
jgi:hypothetical protein